MSFLIVPAEAARHLPRLADDLAATLQAQDLPGLGVEKCSLVTPLEHPNDFLRKTFDQPGLQAVAGMTMFIQAGRTWEMPDVASALIKTVGTAFNAEAYAFNMLVTPTVVVDKHPTA